MINKIDPNGPAMPQIATHGQMHESGNLYGDTYSYGGLSIRAELAAMAMQGILSSWPPNKPISYEYVGMRSVGFADALIAELNKEKEDNQ